MNSEIPPHRRASDNSGMVRFLNDPIVRLGGYCLTAIGAMTVAVATWVLTEAFDHYTKRLEQNTDAVNSLAQVVVEHNAQFSQEFTDHERRIMRLEDLADARFPHHKGSAE